MVLLFLFTSPYTRLKKLMIKIFDFGLSIYINIFLEDNMRIERVAIVGLGALGAMFGGLLSDRLGKENVEFISSKERIEKYKEEGLYVNDEALDFNLVDQDEKDRPADLVIFAVKQTSLDEAIETVRNKVGDKTIIISLLNGILSEEAIGEVYGHERLLYTIAEGMDTVKIGNKVSYSKMGYLWLGSKENNKAMMDRLDSLVELFDRTGFPYKLSDDVIHRLWSKFMLNTGINQVVMINEGSYRTIIEEGPARDMMMAAMKEVVVLAKEEGIDITDEDVDFYLSLVETLDPNNMPSMRQDGLLKKKSEVELFSGTVRRLGKKHNIETPVNDEIYDRVMEIESSY